MIESANGKNSRSIFQLRRCVRKRTRPIYTTISAIAFLLGGVAVILEYSLPTTYFESDIHPEHNVYKRSLDTNETDFMTTMPNIGNYPKEIFTLKELRQGAVILHTGGMIYMFIALAIVCDEFFVPALEVITDKLHLTQDVAGATFMAAGGSAPELFTSVAGLFISQNSVGISTIIGSAVFNILFVIGICGLAAKTVLQLTWWPLFRDSFFYSISLIVLIISYLDWKIHYYEALALLSCYAAYVTFMVFNSRIEKKVKENLCKPRETERARASAVDLVPVSNKANLVIVVQGGHVKLHLQNQETRSRPMSSLKFRAGLLQLMIQTIDPLAEGKVEERAMQLKRLGQRHKAEDAPLQDSNGNIQSEGKPLRGTDERETSVVTNQLETTSHEMRGSVYSNKSQLTSVEVVENDTATPLPEPTIVDNSSVKANDVQSNGATFSTDSVLKSESPQSAWDPAAHNGSSGEEEENEPLDISWPKSHRKRITYVLLAPIIFPLWLTLPDTRRQDRRKYFIITFIGSILWIAFFSTMMVWWASVICVTIGLKVEIIGLTVLAAGTSVPDLLTSVIVARKGFGDMAISSSIGSNIFDITVGLPLPWLVGSLIKIPDAFVSVDAKGLLCSIILLFCMLLVTVGSIAALRWKMHKILGGCMIVLYCGFLAVSVLLAESILPCIEVNFSS